MAWRVARSLNILLEQLNDMYPNRSKLSDGSIGDAAHASRDSDHNPWYGPGIVTARDFTHDPDNGINGHQLASWLVNSRDRRIKYIIWDHKIWQGGWQNYSGPNPHTKHLHLSVVASPLADDTTRLHLGKEDFLMNVSEKDREALVTRVAEIQTKVKNIEAFVEPMDAWKTREQWLAKALSDMQNDFEQVKTAITKLGADTNE